MTKPAFTLESSSYPRLRDLMCPGAKLSTTTSAVSVSRLNRYLPSAVSMALTRYLPPGWGVDGYLALRLISATSGVGLVLGLWWLTPKAGIERPSLLVFWLLTFGSSRLFAGYIETYAPAVAAAMLWTLASLAYIRGHGKTTLFIRDGVRHHFLDGGVLEEHAFHFGGIHHQTAGLDDIIQPAEVKEIPVRVDLHHISRVEPIIPEYAGGELGIAYVSLEYLGTANDQFSRFPGLDPVLSPRMQSTGQVLGMDDTFGKAYYKSQMAVSPKLPDGGRVFLSARFWSG